MSPTLSFDRLPIGTGGLGPIKSPISDTYMQVVRGEHPSYRHWLTPVYERAAVPA